ncbi:MAG TPA: hypothetical protein K8V20_00585, partial [Subdoligranulum variabile]|nr:hypothetical protein [Subdoligranulum variabile]
MAADGSIIIDTRVNTKGAEADLKALQAKAKSTAQQIAALDKSYNSGMIKKSQLAEDLRQARTEAAATARELSRLNIALDAQRNAGLAPAQEDIQRSDRLAATLEKQKARIREISGEYRKQGKLLQAIQTQHSALSDRLVQEQKAVTQAEQSYRKQNKGNSTAAITHASTAMQKFGTRLSGIVFGALLFNVISSALTKMVGWFGSAMQSSDAFRQSLANLQGAASVAAAPLIQTLGSALSYVINLLATGISYLARFISLLTGKSIGAMKSAAKGMNSYGSAASGAAKDTEKATRSLAGFDEITRLDAPQQDSSSGGGGSAGSTAPNYDFVDQTGAGFSSLMDRVQDFWSAFKEALAPSIAAWSAAWEQIKATALAVWPQIQAAASGLWTNALQPLLTYLAGTFMPGVVNSFYQAFAPIVGGAISTAIQVFADFFIWACGILTDAISNILQPALEILLQIWQDMMVGIQNAWNTYGQPLMDGVVAAFRNLESIFSTLYYTVVEPILSNLIDLLQKLWNEHLKQLWDDLLLLFGSVQNTILTFWNNVLAPLINWLVASFGPVFSDVFNAVAGLVSTAVGLMADAIDIILVVLRGLLDFLSAVFRGDWGAAWNAIAETALAVWDRIKIGIKSAVNGIIGFINGMIQAVVNGLNRAIDAVNTLSFDVPDWVPGIGGSSLGFDFTHITAPQIPYLAQGAVIPPNREFMAV